MRVAATAQAVRSVMGFMGARGYPSKERTTTQEL
jgi:hypothetical protein